MLVPAALLATLAAGADLPLRALLAAAAAAFVAAGFLLRRRVWIEDLVVTDRRVAGMARDGGERGLALEAVEGLGARGLAGGLGARDGAALSFAYVRDLGALRRPLAGPRADLDVRADRSAACRTCGIRF